MNCERCNAEFNSVKGETLCPECLYKQAELDAWFCRTVEPNDKDKVSKYISDLNKMLYEMQCSAEVSSKTIRSLKAELERAENESNYYKDSLYSKRIEYRNAIAKASLVTFVAVLISVILFISRWA